MISKHLFVLLACLFVVMIGLSGVEEQLEGEPQGEHDLKPGVLEQAAHGAWSRTARQSSCLLTGPHERLRRR